MLQAVSRLTTAISRRRLLTGAPAMAAASALPTAALSLAVPPLGLEIRRVLPLLKAAISIEVNAPCCSPEYYAAGRETLARYDEFEKLSERVWQVPPQTLGDLLTRAEITRFWTEDYTLDSSYWDERSTAQLIKGVLEMGGRWGSKTDV